MATFKCAFCHKDIKEEDAYVVNKNTKRSFYCNEEHYNKKINKIKYEPPLDSSRRALTDWILDYYVSSGWDKYNINWTMLTAQIKNIKERNEDFNYNWMRYTLMYMTDILGMNLLDNAENNSILNLMEYYFIDAKNFWKQNKNIKNIIEDFNFEDNVITIKKTYKKEITNWEDL